MQPDPPSEAEIEAAAKKQYEMEYFMQPAEPWETLHDEVRNGFRITVEPLLRAAADAVSSPEPREVEAALRAEIEQLRSAGLYFDPTQTPSATESDTLRAKRREATNAAELRNAHVLALQQRVASLEAREVEAVVEALKACRVALGLHAPPVPLVVDAKIAADAALAFWGSAPVPGGDA